MHLLTDQWPILLPQRSLLGPSGRPATEGRRNECIVRAQDIVYLTIHKFSRMLTSHGKQQDNSSLIIDETLNSVRSLVLLHRAIYACKVDIPSRHFLPHNVKRAKILTENDSLQGRVYPTHGLDLLQ
jgi:hypothetical protein